MTSKQPIVTHDEPHGDALSWKGYVDVRVDHLREVLEKAIVAGDETSVALITASEKALQVALEEQRAKWIVANEFRASLNDAAERTMPRAEIEGRFKMHTSDIDMLKAFMYAQQGSKTALIAAIGILLGMIGSGLAIYNTIRRP